MRYRDNQNLFKREGDYWTVVFGGMVFRLRHTGGVEFLARLLVRPGEKIAAVELAAAGGTAAAPAAERARVNVTRSLRTALSRIGHHHPGLFAHFEATIRTGYFCSYMPDPRVPITWEIS